MSAKAKTAATAKKHGASLEVKRGAQLEAWAWAPAGSQWVASGAHMLVGLGAASDVWRDLSERMGEGVEPCTDKHCDCRAEAKPAPRHLRLAWSDGAAV